MLRFRAISDGDTLTRLLCSRLLPVERVSLKGDCRVGAGRYFLQWRRDVARAADARCAASSTPSTSPSPRSSLGTLAGILICIARLYGPKPVRLLAVGFIDIFRALPILVVLIVIYYALPFVRIRLDSFTSATIALSIVLAAFTAEVFRAGIKAIPVGQFEAARALGLPF